MIPHSKPLLGKAEEAAAARVVRSGMLAQGTECAALEQALADYLGVKHVVAVSSGSAALHLALLSLGVRSGDAVALPTYVCTALLNATRHVGAAPKLIDLPASGFNIAPTDLPPDVTCTIVPHMFGHAAPVEAFTGPVIEDCAMAIGGGQPGRRLGSLGALGIFSFYATKVLCAGEGGAVCTNEAALADAVRDLRDYDGRDDSLARYNYKMTDLQAAIARVQLESLDGFIAIRRELAERYSAELADTTAILPEFGDADIPFRYVVRHPDTARLMGAFEAEGVAARHPVYRPLHTITGSDEAFPNTDRAQAEALSIPLYPALSEDEVRRILNVGRKLL